MAALMLTLRTDPKERLDFAALTEALMSGATATLGKMVVGTTRSGIKLGDVFAIKSGGSDGVVIETGGAMIDGIGTGLRSGRIVVEGDAGDRVGFGIRGGAIEIRGSAGGHVGSGASGGVIHVTGSAGSSAGGVAPGKRFGMTGGTIVIDGNAGERTGEKMRRGLVLVRGDTGMLTGARMAGGTVVVEGRLGADAGRLMRRGTVIASSGDIPASFADCGVHELLILRIMARDWARELGALAPKLSPTRVRRYAGDVTTIARGELLVPA